MAEVKERLDIVLVKTGHFDSRERARAAIISGKIFVDGIKVDKCGEKIKISSKIENKMAPMPFVSRGGYKLKKALESFKIELKDKICFDIGASTGGFTDCMLQNGAIKVYSVDVGYGQLAWKLRTNDKVVCLERTNVRYLKNTDFEDRADFASIDVSFISLKKVIPPVIDLLTDSGEIVALIKPQFEAGREKVGKKGVIKEIETHLEVVEGIYNFLCERELSILGIDYSPIKGPEGNIEYLIYFSKIKNKTLVNEKDLKEAVTNSHINKY